MPRVELAPKVATVALGFLTLFAGGGVLVGGLMLAGAGAVARNTGASAVGIAVGGAALAALGAAVLVYALRQWRAVRAIEVEVGAGWTLVDRLGRRTALAAGAAVELDLRCRREAYMLNGIPRLRDVVDGWLVAGERRRRLAPSGPHTYAAALAALGVDGGPPARGARQRHAVTPR